MSVIELGESIPALTPHAASVSLPEWRDNIDYEEGRERVIGKMTTGYPRFFIHKLIVAFAEDIIKNYGKPGQQAMLFPSPRTAQRCVQFIQAKEPSVLPEQLRVVDLSLDQTRASSDNTKMVSPSVSAVIFPKDLFKIAKQYWQHSGDGISSRRAEFCHGLFQEGLLVEQTPLQPVSPLSPTANGFHRGPRRYQKSSIDITSHTKSCQEQIVPGGAESHESSQFLEERFGRNLDVSFVGSAKSAIRRRIAGSLEEEADLMAKPNPTLPSELRGVAEEDVYLYPTGMSSIYHAHRMMLEVRGQMKSISYGFPYVDTLKILEKFGPGVLFYGNGEPEDLDNLEERLKSGERFLAFFCEFPGNPMLKCPDLQRVRKLADEYDFGIIVDETIGNFINVHVLPYADVVVSSLTKIFSGECNVMGGSMILNPKGRYYQALKTLSKVEYEDNYWAEDAIFMERNSRHFVSRIERINENAGVICDILQAHPLVKTLYYPKYNPSRTFYDACRTQVGGYGGLLSFTFKNTSQAIAFYDRIETAKGPSLGTNFTLVSPYVLIAHYLELDWAAQFGVPSDLLRVSVGLEDANDLKARFAVALKAAEEAES